MVEMENPVNSRKVIYAEFTIDNIVSCVAAKYGNINMENVHEYRVQKLPIHDKMR